MIGFDKEKFDAFDNERLVTRVALCLVFVVFMNKESAAVDKSMTDPSVFVGSRREASLG